MEGVCCWQLQEDARALKCSRSMAFLGSGPGRTDYKLATKGTKGVRELCASVWVSAVCCQFAQPSERLDAHAGSLCVCLYVCARLLQSCSE